MGASCDPGYNLPDGCTDAAIDRRFGERGPTCAECTKMYECCCDYGICDLEYQKAFDDEFGNWEVAVETTDSEIAEWARDWISNHMRDMQEEACGMFCG
ncbi:MAG: hypothetical protein ACLUBM_03970 [Collinsella sp.]